MVVAGCRVFMKFGGASKKWMGPTSFHPTPLSVVYPKYSQMTWAMILMILIVGVVGTFMSGFIQLREWLPFFHGMSSCSNWAAATWGPGTYGMVIPWDSPYDHGTTQSSKPWILPINHRIVWKLLGIENHNPGFSGVPTGFEGFWRRPRASKGSKGFHRWNLMISVCCTFLAHGLSINSCENWNQRQRACDDFGRNIKQLITSRLYQYNDRRLAAKRMKQQVAANPTFAVVLSQG